LFGPVDGEQCCKSEGGHSNRNPYRCSLHHGFSPVCYAPLVMLLCRRDVFAGTRSRQANRWEPGRKQLMLGEIETGIVHLRRIPSLEEPSPYARIRAQRRARRYCPKEHQYVIAVDRIAIIR
jgi:hypothetical protein